MRDRLAEAIQLRETGRAKQDQAILEEARTLLLELVAAYPDDAEITFQTAVVHDNLGLERESIPSNYGHSVKDSPDQILNDAYWPGKHLSSTGRIPESGGNLTSRGQKVP
jgi:hypothetical protein